MKYNKLVFLLFTFISSNLLAQDSTWKVFTNDEIGIQSSSISYIVEDKNNNVWIGTVSEGVFHYDGNTWISYNQNNSPLPSNFVTSIAVDAENVKWIGTLGNSGGLTRYDENTWKIYNLNDYGISGNSTYDIKIDKNGTFWMGSYWQGLIEFDGDTTFTVYNSSNTNLDPSLEEIISVNIEMDSVVWCGSELGGAAKFNKNDISWTRYYLPQVDLVVNSIEIDDYGNIWFAGVGFVSKLDSGHNWMQFDYDYTYSFDYYHSILEDEDYSLFLTSDRGLLKLDYSNEEVWTKIQPPNSLLDTIGCFGLMKDHNKNIWIGYNNGYIAVYNPDGITEVTEKETEIPITFSLSQNYPNPFNPTTTIKYLVPRNTEYYSVPRVKLMVYDILGSEIVTLVNEHKTPGSYEVEIDASNLSSGVYFYTLTTGNFSQTRKMLLLR